MRGQILTKDTGQPDLCTEFLVKEAEDGPAAQVHADVQPGLGQAAEGDLDCVTDLKWSLQIYTIVHTCDLGSNQKYLTKMFTFDGLL